MTTDCPSLCAEEWEKCLPNGPSPPILSRNVLSTFYLVSLELVQSKREQGLLFPVAQVLQFLFNLESISISLFHRSRMWPFSGRSHRATKAAATVLQRAGAAAIRKQTLAQSVVLALTMSQFLIE